MNEFREGWKKIFDYKGVATKKEYWLFLMINSIIAFYLMPAVFIFIGAILWDQHFIRDTFILFMVLVVVVLVSIVARRLRMIGLSSWYSLLIVLMPLSFSLPKLFFILFFNFIIVFIIVIGLIDDKKGSKKNTEIQLQELDKKIEYKIEQKKEQESLIGKIDKNKNNDNFGKIIKKYFNYKGRVGRKKFIVAMFMFSITSMMLGGIADILFFKGNDSIFPVLFIFFINTVFFSPIFVRRLHDIGKSGLWMLIILLLPMLSLLTLWLPFISIVESIIFIFIFIFIFFDVDTKDNKYGRYDKSQDY